MLFQRCCSKFQASATVPMIRRMLSTAVISHRQNILIPRLLSSLDPDTYQPRGNVQCRLFHTSTSTMGIKSTSQVFDVVSPAPNRQIKFSEQTLDIPELQPGELLVKIDVATICGSDLHTISGLRDEPTPLILGHEAVGHIVEMGGGDVAGTDNASNNGLYSRDGISIGDRITWSIADSCGVCARCNEFELPQKCSSLFKYGHSDILNGSGLNGCYSDYVLVRSGTHVVKIPDDVPSSIAAPANCALSTVCCMLDVDMKPSDSSALVQGAGLLGIYAVALLKTKGFQHVFCTDIDQSRLKMVEKFGAIPLLGTDSFMERRQTIESYCPEGVDLCIEVAGVPSIVSEGISLLRFGGTYSIGGMVHPNTALGNVTGESIIRKCIHIHGVHNYAPKHLDMAVEFLSQHHTDFPFELLVSPPFQLNNLQEALDVAYSHKWNRVSLIP